MQESRRTRDFFNRQAAGWDRHETEKDARRLERMVARLGLGRGWTVLDVGTGTGVLIPYLAAAVGTSGSIAAVDIAEQMLVRASSRAIAAGAGVLCADVHSIPLASGTVDAAVCYSCFPHFQDKPAALRELFRVLRPGGWLRICHTSGRKAINERHAHRRGVMHDMLPGEPKMKAMLADAGFRGVTIEDRDDSYLATARRPGRRAGAGDKVSGR